MPHEPKKRHSRQRQGKRRQSIKLKVAENVICSNCQTVILPHTVCKICGYYKGQMVFAIKNKDKEPEENKSK